MSKRAKPAAGKATTHGTWYVYVQPWFDEFHFIAKCRTSDEAHMIATIVRDHIKRESGCACLVRCQQIPTSVARREALDYQIERNLALGRKGSPKVEAFAARVAADNRAADSAAQDKAGKAMPAPADPAAKATGEAEAAGLKAGLTAEEAMEARLAAEKALREVAEKATAAIAKLPDEAQTQGVHGADNGGADKWARVRADAQAYVEAYLEASGSAEQKAEAAGRLKAGRLAEAAGLMAGRSPDGAMWWAVEAEAQAYLEVYLKASGSAEQRAEAAGPAAEAAGEKAGRLAEAAGLKTGLTAEAARDAGWEAYLEAYVKAYVKATISAGEKACLEAQAAGLKAGLTAQAAMLAGLMAAGEVHAAAAEAEGLPASLAELYENEVEEWRPDEWEEYVRAWMAAKELRMLREREGRVAATAKSLREAAGLAAADLDELQPEAQKPADAGNGGGGNRAGPGSPTPILTSKQCAVLAILKSLPTEKAILGKDIVAKLMAQRIITSEDYLRSNIIPTLKKHYGVQNKPRIGYYIKQG